jgi:hypothetical protein
MFINNHDLAFSILPLILLLHFAQDYLSQGHIYAISPEPIQPGLMKNI